MACDATAQKKQPRAIAGSVRHVRATRSPTDCEMVETSPKMASCAAVCGTVSPNRRRAYTPLLDRKPHSAR